MNFLQEINIDYDLLAQATSYYTNLGYEQIETPWIVSRQSGLSTSPDGTRGCAFVTDTNEYLVCSAEQGFIEMMTKQELVPDKLYFSVSPCFRNETIDQTHSTQFIKLELFRMCGDASVAGNTSFKFIEDAKYLLSTIIGLDVYATLTDLGADIMDTNGLELGSYGYRCINGQYIAYGTGLALPRASIAAKKNLRFYSPYDSELLEP